MENQNREEKIKRFLDMVEQSDNIVFFGGAGVSTESGIPDFRSVDGIYNQQYDYPPETILSHTFYRRTSLGMSLLAPYIPALAGMSNYASIFLSQALIFLPGFLYCKSAFLIFHVF